MQSSAIAAIVIVALSALPSAARNTAEDWKWNSDYYQTYGEWTVACEDRSDNPAIERCYLRYVDAYARDPFGALFVFATSTAEQGLRFNFEYEGGTTFTKPWIVADTNGNEIWSFDPSLCLTGNECAMTRDTAATFRTSMTPESTLHFSFRDRIGRTFDLAWPAEGFAEAVKDLTQQSSARNL